MKTKNYTYLALGDSYTIGESVNPRMRWPVLLAGALRDSGLAVTNPKIIAKTGWRTDQLSDAIKESETGNQKYDMVSLLIGVNNQYQRESIKKFRPELNSLIDKAIELSKYRSEGVFILSIPDYGVTPFAGEKGPQASKELKQWNAVVEKICRERNIQYFNITPISQKAENDPSLLASDQLHPSGKMYQEWVDSISESVYLRLRSNLTVYSK